MTTRTRVSGFWTVLYLSVQVSMLCSCASDPGTSTPIERIGDTYELMCIGGVFNEARATAYNAQVGKWPSYCYGQQTKDGTNGESHCQAEPGDRLLKAHCSRASRMLLEGR